MRRAGLFPALVTIALVSEACRLAPAGELDSLPTPSLSRPTPTESATAVSSMVGGIEAPPECGFPPGTPLEFAGRSTTATLGVEEAVGDPMSDDPADIYVTRDAFDQGDLRGRLVCAVFVDSPGFVEITVHPDDGGRFVPPTPYPSSTPPIGGISEAQALDVAVGQVDQPTEWNVPVVEAGPIAQILPFVLDGSSYEWAQDLSADRWVWRVELVRGDRAIDVVVDYLDGSVLGTVEYIVN